MPSVYKIWLTYQIVIHTENTLLEVKWVFIYAFICCHIKFKKTCTLVSVLILGHGHLVRPDLHIRRSFKFNLNMMQTIIPWRNATERNRRVDLNPVLFSCPGLKSHFGDLSAKHQLLRRPISLLVKNYPVILSHIPYKSEYKAAPYIRRLSLLY
jgi:hypothetical protein